MERVTVAATKRSSFGASRKRERGLQWSQRAAAGRLFACRPGRLDGVGVDDERRRRVVERPPLQLLAGDDDIGRPEVDRRACGPTAVCHS